jgi:hypothetical protein
MPCIVLQWSDPYQEIGGERCSFILFKYEGKNAWLTGHGTTILRACAMAVGFISQSAEAAEIQRQATARWEAAGHGLGKGKGSVYSQAGVAPR